MVKNACKHKAIFKAIKATVQNISLLIVQVCAHNEIY